MIAAGQTFLLAGSDFTTQAFTNEIATWTPLT
jgi:hypothetical protein